MLIVRAALAIVSHCCVQLHVLQGVRRYFPILNLALGAQHDVASGHSAADATHRVLDFYSLCAYGGADGLLEGVG